MKLHNDLNRLVGLFASKPAPRPGRRAGTWLETLERRLNLAAVLVIETSDAFWLYDDVDSLVAAAAEGSVADSMPSDPYSEFTPQELQVIDELVAELIATEGYSDDDILAITYLDDTTSDELIAGGFFDDPLFDGDFTNDFDATPDFTGDFETTELVESINEVVSETVSDQISEAVAIDDNLIQLPGAAGSDTISLGNEDKLAADKTLLNERAERPAASASLASVEATTNPAIVTRRVAVRGTVVPSGEVATSAAGLDAVPGVAISSPARVLAAIQPMASAVQFALPFTKFATTSLVATGLVTTFQSTQDVAKPTNAPTANDATVSEVNETAGLSYSQISALFGAGGLAVAQWWNGATDSEQVQPLGKLRRRNRRERRMTI